MNYSIAIDGPCGAGKSTVAQDVAAQVGGHYLDTGAMYRAAALYMHRAGVAFDDAQGIAQRLGEFEINVEYDAEGAQHTFLNAEDVTGLLRSDIISMGASAVGTIRQVRQKNVARQKELAAKMFLVCDGRDIGTCVIPDAALKIYLTADPRERARRRYEQMKGRPGVTYEGVLADINERDYNDTHREESPLTKAEDAVEVDTTSMTQPEVVEYIVRLYREKTGAQACSEAL